MRGKVFSIVFCLVLILLLLPFIHAKESYAITSEEYRSNIRAYYADTINIFEPFKVTINFNNKEYRDKVEKIQIIGCNIPFEQAMGFSESSLPIIERNTFKYSGQEQIVLDISMIQSGGISVIGYDDEWHLYPCDIYFRGEQLTGQQSISVKVDHYPYTYGINNMPDGFSITYEDEHKLSRRYERKDSADISIYSGLARYTNSRTSQFFTYEELKKPVFSSYNEGVDTIIETPMLDGKPAPYEYKCTIRESNEQFYGQCRFYGHIIMPVGPVELHMHADQKEPVRTENDMQRIIDEWKAMYLDMMQNRFFESQGRTADFVIDETDENECGSCKEGFVCGACGNCLKSTKAHDPNTVQVELDPKITQTSKSMLNALESQALFRVYPQMTLTSEGEKIDYCDLKEPGITGEITARMESEELYGGFTILGMATDKRESVFTYPLDLKEKKPYATFVFNPNDKKKFMADAKNIEQKMNFTVQVKAVEESETATIKLTPPKFSLKLKSTGYQVQQGSNRVLEVSTSGATTKSVILKATLMGPGKIGLESTDLTKYTIIESINDKGSLKIGYAAPAMGNFDIGSELQSLSMVNLQKQAAAQIAEDAFMAYGGEYVGNVEKLVEAGEYSSKMGKLTESFKAANGAKTIRGVNDGIPGLTDEVGDAMGVNEGKKDATWIERGADVGVAGISIAQTAVSVVTFIPNKLPGVGKLTAGVQTAFSAATNIWKANLKYISKSEKIERAKELYYPAVIVVTAQDISGWTVQDMHTFKIVYQQVD